MIEILWESVSMSHDLHDPAPPNTHKHTHTILYQSSALKAASEWTLNSGLLV